MYVHHHFIKSIIYEGRTSFTELQCTTLIKSLSLGVDKYGMETGHKGTTEGSGKHGLY